MEEDAPLTIRIANEMQGVPPGVAVVKRPKSRKYNIFYVIMYSYERFYEPF
jgi:hypothetical protein